MIKLYFYNTDRFPVLMSKITEYCYSFNLKCPKKVNNIAMSNIKDIRKLTNTSINYDNVCDAWTLRSLDNNSLGISLSMLLHLLVTPGNTCCLNVPSIELFQRIPDVVTTFTSSYLEEIKQQYNNITYDYVPESISWNLKSNDLNNLSFAVAAMLLAMEKKIGYNLVLEPLLAKNKISLALFRLGKIRQDKDNKYKIPKGTNIFYDNNTDLWSIHSLQKNDILLAERLLNKIEVWSSYQPDKAPNNNTDVSQANTDTDVPTTNNSSVPEEPVVQPDSIKQRSPKKRYYPDNDEQLWLDSNLN
jgi:hypothetical protein